MPVKFDETLILHIKHIDEQHRHLIDSINELEIQIKTGRTFYLIEKILNDLKNMRDIIFLPKKNCSKNIIILKLMSI
jgi:hemerythrin